MDEILKGEGQGIPHLFLYIGVLHLELKGTQIMNVLLTF